MVDVGVDYGAIDALFKRLMNSVSLLPEEGNTVKDRFSGAAYLGGEASSAVFDEALNKFGQRWDREMDFVSQDIFAVASNVKSASNAMQSMDQQLAAEFRQ